jgi:cytochrome c oxidase assembly factor CtaG
LAFLFWWAMKVWADATQANFRYTEIYLYIYNTAMLLYFLVVFLVRSTDELPILTGA